MKLGKLATFAAATALLAGCSTIVDAWDAQKQVEGIGNGTVDCTQRQILDLRGYSLEQLVGFALTNRPSVVSAQLAVEKARCDLKLIQADAPLVSSTPWTSPKVALNGGYSAVSEKNSTRLGWQTDGNASLSLSLDVLVWDFGRNSAQVKAAAENVVSAEMSLISEGYTVFDDVCSAYFKLIAADALLKVAYSNEYEYAEHLKQARARLNAGEAQKLDVTRAQLDLAQAREETVAASNYVATSGAALMWALGIDANRGSRDEVIPSAGDALEMLQRGFDETTFSADECFALARTNAPAMAVSRAKLRSASANVDYAISDLLPEINASATLFWADPVWYWSWASAVSQTIFTGFRKKWSVESAVVQMKAAASAVDEEEQNLSHSIEVAVAERDNAKEALATARASVKSARENYETVKAQYQEGDASRIDFTDAISAHATAVGSVVSAYYTGQIAEAKLFALVGKVPVYSEKKIGMK